MTERTVTVISKVSQNIRNAYSVGTIETNSIKFRVRSVETVFRNSVFTIPEFWVKYRIIQNTEYDGISCASNTFGNI
jgi:uncharacterized membrane protein